MSARRFAFQVCVTLLFCGSARTAIAQLQDGPSPDIENSRYTFTGVVNSNAVYVRSGPSENDYPTAKLDKGAEVTVVGLRFEWLKIVPPEGSFCYVAKAYVDRRGNGSIGRVTSTLYVRVGSQLNELKAKIATKLEPGADVQIIGEEQEYFKIVPPQGVYFYINKQFVDPIRPVNLADLTPAEVTRTPAAGSEPQTSSTVPEPVGATTAPPVAESSSPAVSDRASSDTQTRTTVADATPVATEPNVEAELEFDRLERAYAEASLKPLNEQPVSDLLARYQALANSDKLPESLRRTAEFKAEVLKSRLEVQQQFAETRKVQDEMKQKQMALNAEREELEQRIRDSDFRFYTAVGTLRPSSLQVGAETLYRLTDPSNGRTIVYLRSNDTQIAAMIGQFIGVKGDVTDDAQMNLRVIGVTSFELVNPARVGHTIAAQIVPPSLLPGGATARTE